MLTKTQVSKIKALMAEGVSKEEAIKQVYVSSKLSMTDKYLIDKQLGIK